MPDSADVGRSNHRIPVELVFAAPEQLWRRRLDLPAGATIADAVAGSGFQEQFPDYDLPSLAVGVYGRRRDPETPVQAGDRIEIYRALTFDPMESRRRRAAHRRRRRAAGTTDGQSD